VEPIVTRFFRAIAEALEARVLFSGAADLTHAISTLSEARSPLAATAVDGKAFFGGGTGDGFRESNTVDIYDADTRSWSTAALSGIPSDEPADLNNVSAVSVDGEALFKAGDVLNVYDSKTGTWSITSLRRSRKNFAAATAVGDLAIFVGGATAADLKTNSSAAIFNARTGRWSSMKLPQPLGDVAGATTVGGQAVFASGSTAEIYDSASRRWSSVTLPNSLFRPGATTVGTKAIFASVDVGGASQPGIADIYDSVTGQWSTAALSQAREEIRATTVGTKAIFAGGHDPESSAVDVYDDSTGQWSIAEPLTRARDGLAATSVGTTALFGGGEDGLFHPDDAVDLYTDASPAAAISGALPATARRRPAVTVFNTGDADLPAGATGALYASPSRTLEAASVLIGQTTLASPLAAGSSIQVRIPTHLKSLAPGQYHLVAAVDDHSGSAPTPIASQAQTFTIPTTSTRKSPFSRSGTPLHAWPLGA
jgi:hypothetical protein